MYKHILIATDGSDLSNRGVAHGIALAAALKARVTIVTVTEPWSALDIAIEARNNNPAALQQFEAMAVSAASKILAAAAQKVKEAGVPFDTVHVPDQHPADGIIATAEKSGCDLVVMASHGRRGIGRLLLGSQANEVVTHSKIPTLIVR